MDAVIAVSICQHVSVQIPDLVSSQAGTGYEGRHLLVSEPVSVVFRCKAVLAEIVYADSFSVKLPYIEVLR